MKTSTFARPHGSYASNGALPTMQFDHQQLEGGLVMLLAVRTGEERATDWSDTIGGSYQTSDSSL